MQRLKSKGACKYKGKSPCNRAFRRLRNKTHYMAGFA